MRLDAMATYSSEAAQDKLRSKFQTPLKRKAEDDASSSVPLVPLAHEPSFLCQWRAPQMRKHKTWQGDAILVLHTNRTTCSLRSVHDGKMLVTNAAFRKPDIQEGDELYVGGKEILIEKALDATPAQDAEQDRAEAPAPPKPVARARTGAIPTSQFYATPSKPAPEPEARAVRRAAPEPHPRYDPEAPGAVVMRRPSAKHQEMYGRTLPVVDVVLDPELTRILRPHQIQGVQFLYEAVTGMAALEHGHTSPGQGAILADEMGLGKYVWLLTQDAPDDCTRHYAPAPKLLLFLGDDGHGGQGADRVPAHAGRQLEARVSQVDRAQLDWHLGRRGRRAHGGRKVCLGAAVPGPDHWVRAPA